MRQGNLAALLALAAAAACLLPGAAAAGRGLAGGPEQPLLATTKPWDSKQPVYQKPLIGILAQARQAEGVPSSTLPAVWTRAWHGVSQQQTCCPPRARSPVQACHYCPGRSYVAAGFVKWIEAAGARAVPIR